jgi:DNA-binding CsgD family transcriptional regulator
VASATQDDVGRAQGSVPTAVDPLGPDSPVVQMLETSLGALPVAAYANDLDGFVRWQNDAALELVGDRRGTHYSDAVLPDDARRADETWVAVTVGGATSRRTSVYQTAYGTQVRLDAIAAPIRMEGRIVGVFGIVLPADEGPDAEHPRSRLSRRQLDVLRLLVQGKSTREIAVELHLAPDTVRNHIAALLRGLHARTRLEAALIGLRDGFVSLDAPARASELDQA